MPEAPSGTRFDIRDVPFSFCGSWFCFSPVIAERTWADDIHLVSHQNGMHPVLRLVPQLGGERVDAVVTATPGRLIWSSGDRTIELAYRDVDVVRVRGTGLGLRIAAATATLTPFSGTYFLRDPADGSYLFTVYETGRRYRVTPLAGKPVDTAGEQRLATAERAVVFGEDNWELAIEEYRGGRSPYRETVEFDEVAASATDAFARYVATIAPWRSDATPATELAAYVIWSATVAPAGFVTRPAVLMSKHWMDKVWSWDHCFNAMAMASGLPVLAMDQFHLPFDHQDPTGALPDSLTHSEILYNFVKPPIHGWALSRIRRQLGLMSTNDLTEVYRRLEALTRFWLDIRRVPGRPLAHYQHGNDSGWDNATTFDPARVVESADLAAFLVLQLRELGELANELGLAAVAPLWNREADRIRAALLELWTGERFAARAAGVDPVGTDQVGSVPTGVDRAGGVDAGSGCVDESSAGGSLLELMPIVLGVELPEVVRHRLAERIGQHLTEHGLATELPSSPNYLADGYWRGPIWAPATVLIEDGLRRSGFTALADEISARFMALCERSGFAENFDAGTGAGLRDRAYTWTASCYLILAAEYEQRRSNGTTPQPQ